MTSPHPLFFVADMSAMTADGHPAWGARANLSDAQVDAYLERLELDAADIRSRPIDLALLSQLQVSHMIAVPFETTAIQFEESQYDSDGDDLPLRWRAGAGVACALDQAFDTIVTKRRGGYCFSLNACFSGLLRGLGFRLSEYGARVFANRNRDPSEAGYDWTPISHMVLLVDLPDGPWLADCGFGGGSCTQPVSITASKPTTNLSAGETFVVVKEPTPGAVPDELHCPDGLTLYRFFAATEDRPKGIRSPCYHVRPAPLRPPDFVALNFYNSHFDTAPFTSQLVAYRLLPNGSRRTLHFAPPQPGGDASASFDGPLAQLPKGERISAGFVAKHVVRGGVAGAVAWSEDVPMTSRALLAVLREHFGFLPARR